LPFIVGITKLLSSIGVILLEGGFVVKKKMVLTALSVGTFICSAAVCGQYCDLATVIPIVLVGIYFREPAPGKVGRSEIFDLRTSIAKTNPPSKTSI
jgi:hypothetical protein